MRTLEDQTFLLLLVTVSVGFIWVLSPYYQAALWGVIMAIVFVPLYRNLLRFIGQRRRTLASLLSVVIIVTIITVILIASSLVQEASGVYDSIQSGNLDPGKMFQQLVRALPRAGNQSAGPSRAVL
jgi:predicted PurR-regulated permease PerM